MPFDFPSVPPPPARLLELRLRHPGSCRTWPAPDESMLAAGIGRGLFLIVCTETPRAPNSIVLARGPNGLMVRRLVLRKAVASLVSEPGEGESEVTPLATEGVEVLGVIVHATDLPQAKTGLRPWQAW